MKPLVDHSTRHNPLQKLKYDKTKVLWASCMDERYAIEIQKQNDKKANYIIFDLDDKNKVLLNEEIDITLYKFIRPTFEQIFEWQNKALIFLDPEST